MLELIVVMILLGILAAAVLSRLPRSSEFAARAARDELLAALRYAQQLAMADATRSFKVVTTGTSYSLTADDVALPLPEGGGNYPRALATDVTLTPATTLTYNGLGETSATTFTVSAADNWQLCVEASGYAHAC